VATIAGTLNSCGVRFVVVEQLPSAKIDGVCFWIDDSPVIGLSLRFDRLDNFWFVLRHEIEHVLRGDGKEIAILDDLEGVKGSVAGSINEAERAANMAASVFVVPTAKLDSFMARKGHFISEKDVVGFAGVLGTHPAIVVGQLQHKTGKYQLFRKYLVPVRKHIVEASTMAGAIDGWGTVAPVAL
jgi:HTH-type transcriptional regulator / antitoxin HigA